MTNSSAQPTFSITLDDTIDVSGIIAQDVITMSDQDVTLTLPSINSVYIGSGTSSTIDTISINNYTSEFTNIWHTEFEEWVNGFPDWSRIQDMCKEYPGLKIAFEKFKTTYKLVKDDYDTPEDQRKIP